MASRVGAEQERDHTYYNLEGEVKGCYDHETTAGPIQPRLRDMNESSENPKLGCQ